MPTVELTPDFHSVLSDVFGFSRFRGRQSEAVGAVVDGRDAFVLKPTGGGKSLCYQLPGVVLPGTAIVISPLIALMDDQVQGLVQMGVRAAALNSSMPARDRTVGPPPACVSTSNSMGGKTGNRPSLW